MSSPGLGQILAVSTLVAGLSQTLTRERVFEPLRRALGGNETFFGYLVSCPYCASHYFAFLVVPLTGTYGIQATLPWNIPNVVLTWFFSCILVTAIAAVMRVAFWLVDESQGLVRRRQRTEDQETELVRSEVKHAQDHLSEY